MIPQIERVWMAKMRGFATAASSRRATSLNAVADRVIRMLCWQTHAVSDGIGIRRTLTGADLSLSLSMLAINGVTAWFSLTQLARPQPGDTVVVSAAAGAVGSAVGQLANIARRSAVGIAGGPARAASPSP